MTKPHNAASLMHCFLIAIALSLLALTANAQDRTNVVFILADDLGWRDLGCYGSTFYDTPNLDRLAATGTRFTQAYAACPVCSPTRASIMTGKYPARMDTTDWFGAPQPDNVDWHWTRDKPLLPAPYIDHVPLEEVTIAEALRDAGYATFFAGKWHLGGEGYFPEDQGFDINIGGHHRGSPPGGYFAPYKNPKMTNGPDGDHLPDRLARETAAFIETNADKPFFAFLSFYSVHTPLQARDDLKEKYEARRDPSVTEEARWGTEGDRKVRLVQDHAVYAAMVEAMDAAVGKVLDALEAAGVADNTAVFFMSDNGGLSTSEGHPTSNLPLRAGKGWLYEGGIREPMLVRWPGVAQPGSVSHSPVTSTDFYPTILDIAGLPQQPEQHADGISLAPLLRGEEIQRNELYWHYPHYGNQGAVPGAAIRVGDYKLIHWYETNHTELYNLANDPSETNDLSQDMSDHTDELRAKLNTWQQEVAAKYPSENPAADE